MPEIATVGDVLDTYSQNDRYTIALAFQKMEARYRHHMTAEQRDAVGRTAVRRFAAVIPQLKADKKIG